MTPPASHPTRAKLQAFMSGTLDDAEQAELSAHVEQCDECCRALRDVPEEPMIAHLREAPRIQGEPALPAELQNHPRYKIGKFLGSGGMGVVYQAEHRLMDRIVALKILHRDLVKNPRVVHRFRQEVKAAAKLSHPNVVAAYDADQAGDAHFLVMEFVDGISLQRLVTKRGPLEHALACYFIRQAAKGLDHAFAADMVHRDIKPQNLMLTRKGQVKILDFGLARLASEIGSAVDETEPSLDQPSNEAEPAHLTSLGDVMGTPDYMAPEQAFNPSEADIRADIYSLGCTLYYLLTAQTPFGRGSSRAKVYAKKYSLPASIAKARHDLPAGLVTIIERMMAKNPDDRYATPAQVIKALAAFATPAAHPASTQPSVAPPPVVEAAEKEVKTVPLAVPTRPAVPGPPIVEAAGNEAQTFLTRCLFCKARIRIPARAMGASLRCPVCNNFFTSVPEEDATGNG